MRIKGVGLENHRQVAIARINLCHILIADGDRTAIRCFQPRNDTQKRGLAAARHADERQKLSGTDGEIDLFQNIVSPEAFADARKFK